MRQLIRAGTTANDSDTGLQFAEKVNSMTEELYTDKHSHSNMEVLDGISYELDSIRDRIEALTGLSASGPYSQLPQPMQENTLYLIGEQQPYEIWLLVDNKPVIIGSTSLDLDSLEARIATFIDTALEEHRVACTSHQEDTRSLVEALQTNNKELQDQIDDLAALIETIKGLKTNGDEPIVTEVKVIPSSVEIMQGTIRQFDAMVVGRGSFSANVEWRVTGHESATINADGLLSVGDNVPGNTNLVVYAASAQTPSVTGSASVSITALPRTLEVIPRVASIDLWDQSDTRFFAIQQPGNVLVTPDWSVYPDYIGWVDEKGTFTANSTGMATITANYQGLTAIAHVDVDVRTAIR